MCACENRCQEIWSRRRRNLAKRDKEEWILQINLAHLRPFYESNLANRIPAKELYSFPPNFELIYQNLGLCSNVLKVPSWIGLKHELKAVLNIFFKFLHSIEVSNLRSAKPIQNRLVKRKKQKKGVGYFLCCSPFLIRLTAAVFSS